MEGVSFLLFFLSWAFALSLSVFFSSFSPTKSFFPSSTSFFSFSFSFSFSFFLSISFFLSFFLFLSLSLPFLFFLSLSPSLSPSLLSLLLRAQQQGRGGRRPCLAQPQPAIPLFSQTLLLSLQKPAPGRRQCHCCRARHGQQVQKYHRASSAVGQGRALGGRQRGHACAGQPTRHINRWGQRCCQVP